MIKLKKLTLTLVALLSMTAGAWAQDSEPATDPNAITVTPVTGQTNKWTFTMPAGNVELTPIYEPEFTAAFKAGNSNTIQGEKATVTVTESGATTGTDVTANIGTDGKLTPLYEGQTVTLTAAAGYKFRTVEVKKEVASRPLAEAVAADLGKIAGADGNIYDSKDAASTAGTTAVAMIAYVGSATEHATYIHGLAIALANANEGQTNWSTAKSSCEGKTAVTGAAWLLPSQSQWKTMFKANGGKEDDYTGLQMAADNAGGLGTLQKGSSFWTSTESGDNAYSVALHGSEPKANFYNDPKTNYNYARPVLAF